MEASNLGTLSHFTARCAEIPYVTGRWWPTSGVKGKGKVQSLL